MADHTPRELANLLVFSDDWGRHPSSCQHLVRHMLNHRRVCWVNTIGTRTPKLTLATLSRGLEKVRHWAVRPANETQPLPENLRVSNPVMWPWFRSGFDRRLNRALLLRHLKPLLASSAQPTIAVTTIPIVADLLGVLPVARWVYYCVDDFSLWPGLDQTTMRRMEERLVQHADTLIAVSETLQEKLAGMGREAHLLTHGVDLDHWRCDRSARPVPELEGLPRPLVIFWGVIDRRMDLAFLRRLASDMTSGTIVLIGPEAEPDPGLAEVPRLVRLAPVPYERLPEIGREAAVLVMPYADLPVTQAMQPLKLKEYLASGKPVVARDLAANREWDDCLDLVNDPASFSERVRLRLQTGLPESQEHARRRLIDESWSAKAERFEQWLESGQHAVSPTR